MACRSASSLDLCSNFIGASIDLAVQAGAKGLLLIGHMGKLVKLAAGIMNTHSKEADGRMEILAAYAGAAEAPAGMIRQILGSVTVDQALALLEEQEGLREAVMAAVTEAVFFHLKKRAGEGMEVQAILFTNERGILGMTPGAKKLLEELRSGGKEV